MKKKHFKSAIHNFADSFQSIDWTKSGALFMNVLIELNNTGLKPCAKFDFIEQKIEPKEAITKEGKRLMMDYLSWLPEHLKNHDCDKRILETLIIEVSTDIKSARIPNGMSNCLEFLTTSKTKWKLKDGIMKELQIEKTEVVKSQLLKTGFPSLL